MIIAIEKILWGLATTLLLGSGIYFTIRLGFPQFKIKDLWKSVSEGKSGLNTLNLTLAAKIGVGSLAGTALAIYIGGLGTIFWMWISAIICAANTYSESYLSVINRKKDKDGTYYGGPPFYIENLLKNRTLAIIYAVIIILAYVGGFLSIQVNTISKVLIDYININPLFIGIGIAIITSPIIIGGVNKISKICDKIVPIMTIIYLSTSFFIILINIGDSLTIIKNIVIDAFNFKSAIIGTISTCLIGIQRGIFSNEAGIGTAAITSATTTEFNPQKQGYTQIIGVYVATLVICTTTAIIISLAGYNHLNIIDPNGIEITKFAYNYHLGTYGTIIIILTIILFALSTVITGYYYGEANLKYLINSKTSIKILKILTIIILILASVISSTTIWMIVDIFVAILAIINVYSLFKLRNYIKK